MNQLLTWAVECKFTFKSQPLGQALHYFIHDLNNRDKDLYKMIVQETHLGETYWHLEILDYDVLSSSFFFIQICQDELWSEDVDRFLCSGES